MVGTAERTQRRRVWLILTVAFLAVGAVAILSISRLAMLRYQSDFRANLLSSAQLLSSGYEADPSGQGLDRAKRMISGLESIRVIRLEDSEFKQKMFASTESDPLDSDERAIVRRVLETGESTVQDDSAEGMYQAYVAMNSAIGSPTQVLLVSKSSSELLARDAAVSTGICYALGLVLLLSIAFAQTIVAYILPRAKNGSVDEQSISKRGVILGMSLELALALVCASVIATGVFGLLRESDLQAQATSALRRIERLEKLRTNLMESMATGAGTEEAQRLRVLARDADLSMSQIAGPLDVAHLKEIAQDSEAEIRREHFRYENLEDTTNAKNQVALAVFAIASFLSLSAIVLLRTARRQEGQLVDARANIAKQEAAYQHVADNLPIGFYTYVPGSILNTNAAWDRLVGRTDDQDLWNLFVESVHPEDRDRVKATFDRAASDLEPFGIAYRIQTKDGVLRHVETRAVAVKDAQGRLEHVVGFLVDISSRVRAQRLLEDKNREVEATNAMLRGALGDIENNFEAMVFSLVKAVDAKDSYTAGHSERVMAYSLKIGERLGLSSEEMRVLKMGTLIHDIGKIGIPDAILTKPARLSEEEYEIIKQHPALGYKMIESIPTFSECLQIVLHHHERLDGKGYPFGLKGLEIPLLVRICTVSDSFDAMTSDRAYRKGLDPSVAIEELLRASDEKVVDRNIVEILADVIKEEGLTTRVDVSVK